MLDTHRDVYLMFVEDGIHRVDEIMEKTGFSETQVYRILKQTGAREEYRRRITKARRLHNELGVTDIDMISILTGLNGEVLSRELRRPVSKGGTHTAEHYPALRTASELLKESAEHMLADAARNGLADESVKSWMTLANAFEKFKTGEFRLEMIVSGIEDFTAYLRDYAKEADMTEMHIILLVDILNRYRKEKVEQLRKQSESIAELNTK